MSAGGALQPLIAAALNQIEQLAGVFDGAPARARYPYAVIDASTESDWGHKSGEGREVLLAVTVWDDQPARLQELADAAEAEVLAVHSAAPWQLVSLRLIRRKIMRDVAGPWAATIDFRARLLAA